MGAGTRLGRCAAALAVAAVSSSWYFVVPSLRQKSPVARAAEGYFPGVEVETTDAPNRVAYWKGCRKRFLKTRQLENTLRR
jgi:ABC-type sugar transport system substrate-binding protein